MKTRIISHRNSGYELIVDNGSSRVLAELARRKLVKNGAIPTYVPNPTPLTKVSA